MKNIPIEEIVAKLPHNNIPNSESWALRLLNDQNEVSKTIYCEFRESLRPTLRATFQASTNKFMQARIFLTRALVPLTVADVRQFAKIVSELAEIGNRKIELHHFCKQLFDKCEIEIKATTIPKPTLRKPRGEKYNGN